MPVIDGPSTGSAVVVTDVDGVGLAGLLPHPHRIAAVTPSRADRMWARGDAVPGRASLTHEPERMIRRLTVMAGDEDTRLGGNHRLVERD
jgi:hypothetical protein